MTSRLDGTIPATSGTGLSAIVHASPACGVVLIARFGKTDDRELAALAAAADTAGAPLLGTVLVGVPAGDVAWATTSASKS
ncbi:MAG: hypothetical protein R2715_10285 [Ilumatobacteraceae bacterium]